jgi:hypothetical protein
VNIKLYLTRGGSSTEEKKKEDKEEVKEGDELAQLEDLLEEGTGNVIITDDKLTL